MSLFDRAPKVFTTREMQTAIKEQGNSEFVDQMLDNIVAKCQAAAVTLNGSYRLSKRGVPYIVVTNHDTRRTYSVCWFHNSQAWRVFWPFPGDAQIRENFAKLEDVKSFIENGTPIETE